MGYHLECRFGNPGGTYPPKSYPVTPPPPGFYVKPPVIGQACTFGKRIQFSKVEKIKSVNVAGVTTNSSFKGRVR